MSTQSRLSDLLEQQKENAERRLSEIESQWEDIIEQHRLRQEDVAAELDAERANREKVEAEKSEIQLALDRLAESVGVSTGGMIDDDGSARDGASPVSSTPRGRTPGSVGLGHSMLMSPTAALASKVQKSGKSFTQVYTELAKTQEELRREKLESHRLGSVLEGFIADLTERAPQLQAQREETERLGRDLEEMSATLATACEERDIYEREAKQRRLEAEAVNRENGILVQQVADLGRQVRDLARETILRDDPSAAERLAPDGSQLPDPFSGPSQQERQESDTQAVITNQLVTFASLTDLVAQNGRLLRVVRELGAKMEAEERDYRARLEAGENEAVEEAREVISRLQDELRAEKTRIEGMRRERDMFRSMCSAGRGDSGAAAAAAAAASSSSDSSAAHATLANQYSQLQAQFEAFRTEVANDTERLKQEAYQARSEASRAALGAAKDKAGRESAEERVRSVQQSYELARSEAQELMKRCNTLQENLAKRDVAAHGIEEELLTARSSLERLRNEAANLRAEKQLHKEAVERLMGESKAAVTEKSALSELLRNVQSMQSELERSSGESRRRMETQVERLEEQLKESRDRLAKEEEAVRQASMRRDVETTDLKSRLDRAHVELATAREHLAVAKTSVEHLTARSEDLSKQLDAKEEKLAVYERRSGSSVNGAGGGAAAAAGGQQTGNTLLSREQQLEVELADVRGELRSAQVEAEQARSHVEQFKSIAQANEEALAQLQATYDQYKAETDSSLAEKTTELATIRQRLEALATELTTAQNEASAARQEADQERTTFAAEKRTLEDAIAELGSVESRAKAEQDDVRAEMRRQAQLTQEAHAKYESELVAHAEDVKALTAAKEALDRSRSEAREAIKARETAQGNLASSQSSWEAQRGVYEREKDEMRKASQELRSQNEALHKHLETLRSQASEIRQAASTSSSSAATAGLAEGGASSSSSSAGNEELHEVIKYLRREKEIVDLQVELREQECARLRQSVEHTQRSLDEARIQLAEERDRNASATTSAQQHEELMDKINQLSILRESNATLRDETERAQRKVSLLETQLSSTKAELDPIKEQLRIAQVELEASQGQLRLTQEDNKRWQARAQSILQQYNRIDPEDLKRLEERAQAAEKVVEEQKVQLDAKANDVEEQAKATEAAKAEAAAKQTQFDKLRQQSIERIKSANQKSQELTQELERVKAESSANAESAQGTDELRTECERLNGERETLAQEKQQLEVKVQELESAKEELERRVASSAPVNDGEGVAQQAAEGAEAPTSAAASEEVQKKFDEEKAAWEKQRETFEGNVKRHLENAKKFLNDRRAAEKDRDEAKKQLAESEARLRQEWSDNHADEIEKAVRERTAAAAPGDGGDGSDALQGGDATIVAQLRKRIEELEVQLKQRDARIAELEASLQGTPQGAALDQIKAQHQEELQLQESTLAQQFTERQKQAVEAAVRQTKASAGADMNANGASTEAIEEQVQARLKAFEDERGAQQQSELQAAVEAKERELKAAHEEALKARYEAGKEEANLRNKLVVKQRDNKIEKLTKEIAQLKGESIATPTSAEGGASAPATAPTGPAVRPVPAASSAAPSGAATRGGAPAAARGGAAGRGGAVRPAQRGGRGGGAAGAATAAAATNAAAATAANSNKRKLEGAGPNNNANNGAAQGGPAGDGNAPKKQRAAGSVISIRGGAGRGGGQAGGGGGGA